MAEGSSDTSTLWWFIGIMFVLGALWLSGNPAVRQGARVPSQLVQSPLVTVPRASSYYNPISGPSKPVPDNSSVLTYKTVRLGSGTAASATLADQEYITLTAASSNNGPVDITGWFLTNNRGAKLLLKNDEFEEQPSVRLRLPAGAKIFSPSGQNQLAPILLNPGERAYVVTGGSELYGDYQIKNSFQVNKCLGFVEEENDYRLVPPLSGNLCPDPEEEVDTASLPSACYAYVRSLARCHIPKITNKEDEGWRVDGRSDVPKTCVNLIRPHLNYAACVNRHLNDPDFLKPEWRIYLNQRWEMWDRDREVITLSDAQGRIVDQLSY